MIDKIKGPRVLISVLVYNKVEDALNVVACFRRQKYPNYDIIVVDNASSLSHYEELRKKLSDIRIVRLDQNLGFAGGNNVALQIAKENGYDHVIISNDDIVFGDELVTNLIETAESKPKCGLVGVIEEDYYTGKVRAIGGDGFNFLRSRGKWTKNLPSGKKMSAEFDYVQGALMMLSKEALDSGIKLDEQFFMYCEEIDLGFQLKKLGLKAIVDLRTSVKHKSVPRNFIPYQGYYIQRNRLYLSRKHASGFVYLLSLINMTFVELPIKCLIRIVQGHSDYARACVAGFCDSFMGKMRQGRFVENK